MTIQTTDTKETLAETATTTVGVYHWGNHEGVDFTVTHAERGILAHGSLQWEDLNLLQSTLSAAQSL